MTNTDLDADDDQPQQEESIVDRVIMKIPASRWLVIRRALDQTSTVILSDAVLQLVVAAQEMDRQAQAAEGGRVRDDWPRFLAMSMEELAEACKLPDQPKSDGPGPDHPPLEPGGLGAAGDGAGLPEGAGRVVPADRPVTS